MVSYKGYQIMKWFFKLLEKLGRKYAIYSGEGDVLMEKYVLIGGRSDFWIRFPSVNLHHLVKLRNGDQAHHTHIATFWSIILKGGYTEDIAGQLKMFKPGDVNKLHYSMMHSIRTCEPNTWTLFCQWFKSGKFFVKQKDGSLKKEGAVWLKVTPELVERMEKRRRRMARLKVNLNKEI
jgi:hypothetical protein